MIDVHFRYSFHPIGQGLFSTGQLDDSNSPRRFDWIFDCGTSSSMQYLQQQIAEFSKFLAGNRISLACLSHFDKDHVNGARELLSFHRVDTLVLPYFPLVERMAIAIWEPEVSEDYLRFLIDPAGYMYAIAGDNLGNVILIAGGNSPPEQGEEPERPNVPDDDNWDFRPPDTKLPEPLAPEDLYGLSDPGSSRPVRVYGHEKPFTVGGIWEFMFYNEHRPDKKIDALRVDVANILRKFRKPDGLTFYGEQLVDHLKQLYDREFGKSGYARNRISLVAYSGPIFRADLENQCISGVVESQGLRSLPWPHAYHLLYSAKPYCKISIGYFGDFPLTTPLRLGSVRKHFGYRRWSWLEVVQIPHHGSHHSWYKGASSEFEHQASVISSARLSRDHPSDEVLDDLRGRGIMLVNELQGAGFIGHVGFK